VPQRAAKYLKREEESNTAHGSILSRNHPFAHDFDDVIGRVQDDRVMPNTLSM
jgi:hypothetical protein